MRILKLFLPSIIYDILPFISVMFHTQKSKVKKKLSQCQRVVFSAFIFGRQDICFVAFIVNKMGKSK